MLIAPRYKTAVCSIDTFARGSARLIRWVVLEAIRLIAEVAFVQYIALIDHLTICLRGIGRQVEVRVELAMSHDI